MSPARKGPPGSRARAALRVTHRFSEPPERVFDSWLDPKVASRWLFATASQPMVHVEIDARVEGSFRFVDRRDGASTEYTGEYVEIVRNRRLVFTLSMERDPQVITRVTVEIAPLKAGCELRLTHENVPQARVNHVEERWTGVLYGLEVTLDEASTGFHHYPE